MPKNVGDVLVLQLDLCERKLRLRLKIKDQAVRASRRVGGLSLSIDADYDLFVNKLLSSVEEFLKHLRRVKPEKLD
jgi:hypothetical protein